MNEYHYCMLWSRVPCDYKNKNLALRVEESSQKPHYLAIKLLYQGGQTEVVAVDVAQVHSNCFQLRFDFHLVNINREKMTI